MVSGQASVVGEEAGEGVAKEQPDAGQDGRCSAEMAARIAGGVEILTDVLNLGLQLGGALMQFAALLQGAPLQIFNGRCVHI